MKEMQQSQTIPIELFNAFPPEQRPQKTQKISATAQQHQSDYDQKEEAKAAVMYTFGENEKGKTMVGANKIIQQAVVNNNVKVNLQFTLPKTNEKEAVSVRVRADQTFTIKCNKTHLLADIIQGIR